MQLGRATHGKEASCSKFADECYRKPCCPGSTGADCIQKQGIGLCRVRGPCVCDRWNSLVRGLRLALDYSVDTAKMPSARGSICVVKGQTTTATQQLLFNRAWIGEIDNDHLVLQLKGQQQLIRVHHIASTGHLAQVRPVYGLIRRSVLCGKCMGSGAH